MSYKKKIGKNMKVKNILIKSLVFGSTILAGSNAMSDDIEIYKNVNASEARNNVFMLLDSSGSLGNYLNGRTLKEQLDEAVVGLLEALPDDSYVGLGRYNHPGGSIVYPISRLGDEAESVKFFRVNSGDDDAYEKASTGQMFRFTETLEFDSRLETRSFRVNSSSDHAEICSNGTGLAFSSSIIDIENDLSGINCGAGNTHREMNAMLFRGLDVIPEGYGVSSARIDLRLFADSNGRSVADIFVEDSVNPAPYTNMGGFSPSDYLFDREYVKDSSGDPWGFEWRVGSGEFQDTLYTYNFAPLVEKLVNRTDWSDGNGTMSVLFQDGKNAEGNNTRFYTYNFWQAGAPNLTVDYYDKTAINNKNEVAIRFENPNVPTNVDVTNGRLVITPAGNSNYVDGGYIDIYLVDGASPSDITDTNYDISSRTKEAYSHRHYFPYKPENDTPYSIDISDLLEKKFEDADWNPEDGDLMLVLKTEHLDSIYSAESGQAKEPFVVFSHNVREESLGVRTFTYTITDSSDDAEEEDGFLLDYINTTSSRLDVENKNAVGLIFRDIDIPKLTGTMNVEEAYLEVTSYGTTNTSTSTRIRVQDNDNPNTFGLFNFITNKSYYSGYEDWNISSGEQWVHQNKYQSPDISSFLNQHFKSSSWDKFDSVGISLLNSSGGRSFYSYDGSQGRKAKLIIKALVPLFDKPTTVREALISKVDEIPASGNTPIPGSLYEVYQYMLGEAADFGTYRYPFDSNVASKRLSDDDTFVGGTHYYPFGCTPENLNSVWCYDEAINGDPIYVSPMNQNVCETNHVILLTDGQPTGLYPGSFQTKSGKDFNDEVLSLTGKACGDNDFHGCAQNLAEYMNTSDLFPSIPDKQSIKTHVVAFNETDPNGHMKDLASIGGGSFTTAFSSTQLKDELVKIFDSIYDASSTIVTPGVAVNNDNRFEHSNELYYAVFKPSQYTNWVGNVKKYKFDKDPLTDEYKIYDKNGNQAIDGGFFADNSQDFWSDVVDGNNARLGGAASNLEYPRRAFTYTGSGEPSNVTLGTPHKLVDSNANLTKSFFDMDGATDNEFGVVKNWINGVDVNDVDTDGDFSDVRKRMGSALHSRPILVSYGGGENTVFTTTNEGFMHAVDANTGEEYFSFIPPEMVKKSQFLVNNETGNLVYGWDSSLVALRYDENKNNVIDYGSNDFVYLYGGMRRGGDYIYALDVTNAKGTTKTLENKLLFRIKPQVGTAFERMGQTWSQPVVSKVRINGSEKVVLVFAGGYDTLHDDDSIDSFDDNLGNQLYIVDAKTGDLIWWASETGSGADEEIAEMQFSIPAKPAVVDKDRDGFMDHVYIGDLGGQLFRFDFDNFSSTSSANLASGKLLAKVGKTDPNYYDSNNHKLSARRIYETPAVAKMKGDSSNYYGILFGSGYRAHPLDETINEKVFMIKDYEALNPTVSQYEIASPYTISDLADVTLLTTKTASNTALEGKNGWYINLGTQAGTSGEKLLGEPLIFDGNGIFTTYIPNVSIDSCGASPGKSIQYSVDLRNGSAKTDGDSFDYGDRIAIDDIVGITSGAKIIYTDNGNKVLTLTNTTLKEMGNAKGTGIFREFWYQLVGDDLNDAINDIKAKKESDASAASGETQAN